jgi:hypothetical protein
MALAQHEAVPKRIFRAIGIDAKNSAIQHGEDFGHRQRTADVRASGAVRHLHGMHPDIIGQYPASL